jgi:hypothetical protein
MQNLFVLLLLSCLLGACTESLPQNILENAPEASLVVAENIMSPEDRALENKVANRTLLQKVVDGSEKFQKIEYSYACNANAGGLLAIIKDESAIKGIRFAASEDGWNEFVGLYYKGNELSFVVHEKGKWVADQENDIQTVFYLDDAIVIRCMRKQVSGPTENIEQLIQEAEFAKIATDNKLLQKIKTYEDLFINKVTKENIARHFCH